MWLPILAARNLALALAGVAGYVDAVGYLTLHHLFTAHMTGNASKLGVALAHGRLADALPLALAPVFFVAGIAAGTVLVDLRSHRLLFAVQAALVAAYMGYGGTVVHGRTGPTETHVAFYVLAALATVALGLQTAALTEASGATVRTTYVSGMLTRLAMTGTRRLLGREAPGDRLRLLAGIWAAYVACATGGAYGLRELSVWCLAVPVAALLVLALPSTAWPRSS
jgi:uncharacterized membrane protein YoaK (UPF0700 family)